MAHTKASILAHPHLNPAFKDQMGARLSAQRYNRGEYGSMSPMPVPKQPSRYMPHIGAKEARRYTPGQSLGQNASRVLRAETEYLLSSKANADHLSASIKQLGEGAAKTFKSLENLQSSIMQVGQTVTWTSSNLEKTGEIVAVVPAGEHPSTDLTPKVKDPGATRDHESYVVKANGKHYWPRVSLLSIGGA